MKGQTVCIMKFGLGSDVVRETTVVASDAKSGDDNASQSVQNENIARGYINSEKMQRSASPTTIDSPNTYITMMPVQGQPFRAFGDDIGYPGLQNGEVKNLGVGKNSLHFICSYQIILFVF